MEPEALSLTPLVKSWLRSLPPKIEKRQSLVDKLDSLYQNILDDSCYYMRKNCIEPVTTVNNNLCQSSFRILDSYFSKYHDTEIKKIEETEIDDLESMIKNLVSYALIWSIACTTNSDGRKRMDAFMRNKFVENDVDFPKDKSIYDW